MGAGEANYSSQEIGGRLPHARGHRKLTSDILSNYQLPSCPLQGLVLLNVRIIGSASFTPCFERILTPALDHLEEKKKKKLQSKFQGKIRYLHLSCFFSLLPTTWTEIKHPSTSVKNSYYIL